MTELYGNWPTTFEPPTRRIVDPALPVLISVSMTIAGAGGTFGDGTALKVRAEGLAMDVKVQGTLHAWAKTTRGQWICCLSYRIPTGNGKGFLQIL